MWHRKMQFSCFLFPASLVKSLRLKIPLLDDSTICIINNKRITPFQALPALLGHDSIKKCFTPINLQSVLWFMRLLKSISPLCTRLGYWYHENFHGFWSHKKSLSSLSRDEKSMGYERRSIFITLFGRTCSEIGW